MSVFLANVSKQVRRFRFSYGIDAYSQFYELESGQQVNIFTSNEDKDFITLKLNELNAHPVSDRSKHGVCLIYQYDKPLSEEQLHDSHDDLNKHLDETAYENVKNGVISAASNQEKTLNEHGSSSDGLEVTITEQTTSMSSIKEKANKVHSKLVVK